MDLIHRCQDAIDGNFLSDHYLLMIKLVPESCMVDQLMPDGRLSDEGIYLQADLL